ncbi:phage portal protein [Loigolactobacillus backii]|uniref:phage portal protein n=1 Tax=Loigolactobacillus backii TaxID=375175 RepID=UPI0022FD9C9E|nr:phage portal protein [Loigolactobacillus backii]MDA5388776.1 phage portal protein [Loigolactobacillus backii]MDA5391269.1 phage portal protein [Loigolactobacillus backii]
MSFFYNGNDDHTASPISDPFLDALVSLSSDDPTVFTGANALKNSDVFAAIRIIASDIASSPISSSNVTLQNLLNLKPNNLMDAWHFKFALVVNMLLNGNSFAEIIKDSNSKVSALNFIPNSEMTVTQDDSTGKLTYNYTPINRTKRLIAPESILHFRYFTQDGITGLSPLYALHDELKIQHLGNNMLSGFFANGIQGTGILKVHQTQLDKSAKKNIRDKFEDANSGSLRTIVLDDDMDYSTLEVNTDILKLVNSNDWSTRQIAKVFGLPPEKLGVENEHSSNEQSNLLYLQNTLGHYFDVFTSELAAKLTGSFEFNTDELLSVDPETQQSLAVKGIQGGILTINEAREKLGLNSVTGGDEIMASLNYTPLSNLVVYQDFKENKGAVTDETGQTVNN